MLGQTEDVLMPSALAIEMLHCFTLIHDDLPCMDNSDFRRGQPSSHKKFGEAVALLTGDGLIPLAVETMLQTPNTPIGRSVQATLKMMHAIGPRGVIAGQTDEMAINKTSTIADIISVHFKKTGELFSASILIPAELAGLYEQKKSTEIEALEFFSKELGVAFQIADDFSDEIEDKDRPLTPTNILFYQKKEEAGTMALSRLNKAMNGIKEIWQSKADPLIEISQEVYNSIAHAIPNN
jgi:geranylgeranyl diphosphate synthase type II